MPLRAEDLEEQANLVTRASIEDATRKEAKKKNKLGSPTKLPSKLLAVLADLSGSGHVYVAESAGLVKRVNVDVSS